jgi:hypothetical protein
MEFMLWIKCLCINILETLLRLKRIWIKKIFFKRSLNSVTLQDMSFIQVGQLFKKPWVPYDKNLFEKERFDIVWLISERYLLFLSWIFEFVLYCFLLVMTLGSNENICCDINVKRFRFLNKFLHESLFLEFIIVLIIFSAIWIFE